MSLQSLVYRHLHGNEQRRHLRLVRPLSMTSTRSRGFNEHLLIGATDLPLLTIIDHIHDLDGLAIASHIDRESFSVIGPARVHLPGHELRTPWKSRPGRGFATPAGSIPIWPTGPSSCRSDAHFYEGTSARATRTSSWEEATIAELRMAFRRCEGRFCHGIAYAGTGPPPTRYCREFNTGRGKKIS